MTENAQKWILGLGGVLLRVLFFYGLLKKLRFATQALPQFLAMTKKVDSSNATISYSSALLKQAQSPSLLESRANLSYTLAFQSNTRSIYGL